MPDYSRLRNILLLTSDSSFEYHIRQLLQKSIFSSIDDTIATSCAQGRRILEKQCFDLCMIDAPLNDELGFEFSCEYLGRRITQVIFVAEEKICEQLLERSVHMGIYLQPKPLTRVSLFSAMAVAQAAFSNTRDLHLKNTDLLRKIDALRIIDRAKCLLMQYLGMSEADAHRYIEKQAMNLRISKKTIAEHILKTYDN